VRDAHRVAPRMTDLRSPYSTGSKLLTLATSLSVDGRPEDAPAITCTWPIWRRPHPPPCSHADDHKRASAHVAVRRSLLHQ